MMLQLLILISSFLISPLNGKSISGQLDYPQFCYKAAHDEELFVTFRRHGLCRLVVDSLNYETGLLFEKSINESYPYLLPYFKEICQNDKIGDPITQNFSTIGICAPNTLRYVKIVGDLQKEFGDLSKLNIVEIGGGYGGQCLILNTITGFSSYTIVDLPECLPLINKYLQNFNLKNYTTIANNLISTLKSDLVISNYAISEIAREEQLIYLEKIINLAPRGYIIYNDFVSEINSFNLDEFISNISIKNRKINVKKEEPNTYPTNFLITWNYIE